METARFLHTLEQLAALDRPVWSSLNGGHRHFALGDALAKRYPREIGPFAALADDSPSAWESLAALVEPGESVMMVTPQPVIAAPGFSVEPLKPVLQMLASRDAGTTGETMLLLGDADAAEMRSLTALTNPGPFGTRTHELGEFLGVRSGSMLAAMTGERMRFGGMVEVSAVCVHPEHRGKAYAKTLMVEKMRRIVDRGALPFLHVYPDNRGAIALYESLGFVGRRELYLTKLTR
jgi:predicted GNAT family acetyltransferase